MRVRCEAVLCNTLTNIEAQKVSGKKWVGAKDLKGQQLNFLKAGSFLSEGPLLIFEASLSKQGSLQQVGVQCKSAGHLKIPAVICV